MTDSIKIAIGIIGQVVPLLCMLSIPVLNWINKPKSGLFKMGNCRTVNDKYWKEKFESQDRKIRHMHDLKLSKIGIYKNKIDDPRGK